MSPTLLIFLGATAFVAGTGMKDAYADNNCEDLMELSQGERTISVHVFNLTNPEDFLNASLPLPHVGKFQEIHPGFTFWEIQTRHNCKVVDNSHVGYENLREILPESPPCALEVPLTTANIAFAKLASFIQEFDPLPSFALYELTREGEEYVKRNGITVTNLLQNGYDTSLISTFLQDKYPKNLTELQKDNFSPFNELIQPKNFTVHTDSNNFGDISQLDGREMGKSSCNPSVGTEGYFFEPNVTKDTILHFYSEDICSVIPIVFEANTIYEGIPAMKFVFSEDAMKKAACDCEVNEKYPDDVKACFPDGAVDVKTCQNNFPYVVSLPHFLKADAKYRENIAGMSPRDVFHKSYFIIEPVTGHVFESSVKFQWNINLRKFSVESDLWDGEVAIQDTIFPLFWTEKKFMLAKEKVMSLLNYLEEEKPATTTAAPTTVKVPETTVTTKASQTTITTTQAPSNFKMEQMQADINQLYKDIRSFLYITWSFLGLLFIAFAASWFYYLKNYKRILQTQSMQVMYPAKM